MSLSNKAIDEFKEIYEKEFNKKISNAQTKEMGEDLINLFKIIYRPIPKNNNEYSETKNKKTNNVCMNYRKWIKDFMTAWEERKVEAVMKTISKDCEYYETVFDKPCSSYDEIRNLWKVVPTNQKDIEYDYRIISENDDYCIINFNMTRTLIPSNVIQRIDGIFQISLDKNGLCNFFKQWRSVKEE